MTILPVVPSTEINGAAPSGPDRAWSLPGSPGLKTGQHSAPTHTGCRTVVKSSRITGSRLQRWTWLTRQARETVPESLRWPRPCGSIVEALQIFRMAGFSKPVWYLSSRMVLSELVDVTGMRSSPPDRLTRCAVMLRNSAACRR